ncbi:protein translocase subunit SecD [Corynebacterium pilosum]|uniref:Protein translocase subunit SecD n=1 Tax=Corynebacterium pilosum TaxID=35756 RepID=A0A376CR57_9CORY|nr:protein translocase subunit SecD [Corynebacterium pilosum]STC70569.1 preprotein translocase subunit SecD [Corynebacterium pilosum]
MSVTTRRTQDNGSKRQWPKRALAVFVLIVAVVYALVFFTGDRSATPKLGIDLQGGTRVTLVPQGDEPTQDQLDQARTILENRVNGMGVSGAEVVVDGNTLVITVAGDDTSEVRNLGQTSQLMFRPVAQPGMPDMEALPEVMEETANDWVEYGIITEEQANESLNEIFSALNQTLGEENAVETPTVTAEPLPEPANSLEAGERRQELTAMLQEDRQSEDPTQQLASQALMRCEPDSTDPLAGTDEPELPLVSCDPNSGQALLLEPVPLLAGVTDEDGPRLTGNQIDTNKPINGGFNPETGQMEISFSFKQDGEHNGSQTWAQLTSEKLGQQIAITLDSQIISAPVIQGATPVGSATSITGDFTQEEAQALANNLRYGALPLSFAGENGEPGGTAQTVPPSLGEASLKAGFVAGLVGLVLIAIFVFTYYRMFGFISLITLVGSGVLVYGMLVLLGRWIGYSLDLSGVAGLIIGIGATADSFVVLYERIKDEVRAGKTFRSATARGWDRAKQTIVTGNMVTLIGAVIIYFLAVGEVKGFAFTMGLTTIFDLLVTFLVTAPLMILASRNQFFAKPSVNGMGKMFALAEADRKAGRDPEIEATKAEAPASKLKTDSAPASDSGLTAASISAESEEK